MHPSFNSQSTTIKNLIALTNQGTDPVMHRFAWDSPYSFLLWIFPEHDNDPNIMTTPDGEARYGVAISSPIPNKEGEYIPKTFKEFRLETNIDLLAGDVSGDVKEDHAAYLLVAEENTLAKILRLAFDIENTLKHGTPPKKTGTLFNALYSYNTATTPRHDERTLN